MWSKFKIIKKCSNSQLQSLFIVTSAHELWKEKLKLTTRNSLNLTSILSPLFAHSATDMRSIALAKQWKLFSWAKKRQYTVSYVIFSIFSISNFVECIIKNLQIKNFLYLLDWNYNHNYLCWLAVVYIHRGTPI